MSELSVPSPTYSVWSTPPPAYAIPPEYSFPGRVVTDYRITRPTSPALHITLTVLTGGLWALLVWLPLIGLRRAGARRVRVERTSSRYLY